MYVLVVMTPLGFLTKVIGPFPTQALAEDWKREADFPSPENVYAKKLMEP